MQTNTTEPQTEAEAIASWFTDEEVKQWLRARTSLYGLSKLVLRIDSDSDSLACGGHINGRCEFGSTLDEAVAKLRLSLPTPATIRDQARALLKQAAELESEQERSQTDELRTEGKKSQVKPNFHD